MNSPEARTLMETFGFTSDDLRANREGQLTERQQERVRAAQAQYRHRVYYVRYWPDVILSVERE